MSRPFIQYSWGCTWNVQMQFYHCCSSYGSICEMHLSVFIELVPGWWLDYALRLTLFFSWLWPSFSGYDDLGTGHDFGKSGYHSSVSQSQSKSNAGNCGVALRGLNNDYCYYCGQPVNLLTVTPFFEHLFLGSVVTSSSDLPGTNYKGQVGKVKLLLPPWER